MCFKLEILLVCTTFFTSVYSKYVPFLDPGFFFDYNKPGQPVPIPITEQCETIHLVWGRNGARGPNPTAPYYMQVYASTFISPFVIPVGSGLTFDWEVPFAPNTQYQICMFDRNGVTGGCQSMYTVIQNSTTTTPTCQNVTAAPSLEVLATVPGGPMSQYGFIDQCTDLTITPKTGKPPFILTVAPALHPPYNITSDTMDPIDWTVSLSWAFPFFLSLVSSDGKTWAFGPMHAGGFGPSDCLAPGSITRETASSIAIGTGIGSVLAGLGLGILCAFLFIKLRQRKRIPAEEFTTVPPPYYEHTSPLPPASALSSSPAGSRSLVTMGADFLSGNRREPDRVHVEPYTVPRSSFFTDMEGKACFTYPGSSPRSASVTAPGIAVSPKECGLRPLPPLPSPSLPAENRSSVAMGAGALGKINREPLRIHVESYIPPRSSLPTDRNGKTYLTYPGTSPLSARMPVPTIAVHPREPGQLGRIVDSPQIYGHPRKGAR